jgi:hypothetical protein
MAYEGVPFCVVELERGRRYTLYTIRFQGYERTEVEKWTTDEEINSHEEFDEVWSSFRAIPQEGLPDDCFFKRDDYEDYGWVTPFVSNQYHAELRLYCIHREDANWILAGNGCVKPDSGPLQQFPDCEFAFDNILSIDRRIRERVEVGTEVERENRGEHLMENPFFGAE